VLKQLLIVGALSIASAPVFAIAAEGESAVQFQTIVVQAGQGGAITLRVPIASSPDEQPYALTGEKAQGEPPVALMRVGQSDFIAVPAPR
jgi:hypothetical protein